MSSKMIHRYKMRDNFDIVFSENAVILDMINNSLSTYSEGIFSKVAGGVGTAAGNVAVGVGKVGVKTAGNVAKGGFKAAIQTAQGVDKFVDKNVLGGQVGSTIKFYKKKLQTMFKTMIKAVMVMLDNLYQNIFGVEKRLERLIGDIDMAITKRHPGGKYPDSKRIITENTLKNVGLDLNDKQSRASLLSGYLQVMQQNPLLDGVHFGDEKSLETAFETLVKRITGTGAPYDKITPSGFREDLVSQLNVFDNVDDVTTRKKVNKSVNVDNIEKKRESVPGRDIAAQSENALQLLKNICKHFKNLRAVEFLKREKQHLSKIGDEIDRLVANMKEEEIKEENISVNEDKQKQINKKNENEPQMDMSKSQKLIHVLLVEYSNSLNNTILNLSKFYEHILTSGKEALTDYYDATQ